MSFTYRRDFPVWEEESRRNRQPSDQPRPVVREWSTVIYTPAPPPVAPAPSVAAPTQSASGKAAPVIAHTAPYGETRSVARGSSSAKARREHHHPTTAASIASVPKPRPLDLRLSIPLPSDVDHTFQIPVNISGQPGLQLARCEWINKQMPNGSITRLVDGADRCIDDLVLHQRLQRGAEVYMTTKLPTDPGFTVAHLLTLIVRRQYDGWLKTYGRIRALARLEDLVGRGEAVPPNTEVSFDHLYIVAIRRSDSRDGRLRLFPQLEVRI
ncbi:hypothetical protein FKP32DRAFT_1599695 [Trametes sanguinea]|nr:hypothetical protein FKP32DRAFT_1599695 [Trametes sanguinea]